MSSIATIRIAQNQPKNKVNSLGLDTRTSFVADLKAAFADDAVKAIVSFRDVGANWWMDTAP